MISDHLSNWQTLPGFSAHPVWRAAFEWIECNAANADLGYYDLGTSDIRVRVMEYETKERQHARYEGHLNAIDLQYTIEGAEGIEFTPVNLLKKVGDYDSVKDFQFFEVPATSEGRVDNVKGRFSILYPHDAHMPQLRVDNIQSVRKLVVKIPVALVS